MPDRISCAASMFLVIFTRIVIAQPCSPQLNTAPELPSITRGNTVTVHGECLPKDAKVVLRTGNELRKEDRLPALVAKVADDSKSLTFQVPVSFPTGRYLVSITSNSKEYSVQGDMTVLEDAMAKVKIDATPITVYPREDNTYQFEIPGENLGKAATDNLVIVEGRGPQTARLSYDPVMEGRKLKVSGLNPGNHDGVSEIRVRVGSNTSEEAKPVTFSTLSEAKVRALAFVTSFVFGLMVFAIVWNGIKLAKNDDSGSVLDWFFLDRQTSSYSLSKFQLIAWTAVAVFGYVYVLLCRALIQWDFHFPEIPNGWPTLLGVSAATTVAAVGITGTRGSKGAGPLKPSFADFISSGGMVTGDRFQFFVWTLVGFLGFLLLVLLADPATMKEMPDVPQGFLYLMGISAAGYLGGKVVRLPGPVIHQLLASASPLRDAAGNQQPVKLSLDLQGENLSTDATIKIDGVQLRPKDEFTIEPVKSQDAPADASFCSELKVVLENAAKYVQGEYQVTFTNKDGQMAVANFPIDPLKIDTVGTLTAGTTAVPLSVSGENFGDNMTAEWIDPDKNVTLVSPDKVSMKSDTKLEVTLTPGASKGQGTVILISTNQLRATSPPVKIQ